MRKLPAVLMASSCLAFVGVASAQTTDTTPTDNSGTAAAGAAGATDHAGIVHAIGMHYFGSPEVASYALMGTTVAPTGSTAVPTIGIRTWFTDRIALDAGIGFIYAGGSASHTEATTVTSFTLPTEVAFGFQAGLPIAVADYQHLTFFIEPELGFYHGSGSFTDPVPAGATMVTSHTLGDNVFAIGGELVCEMHLGFIRLPRISLEARFGLFLNFRSTTNETATNGRIVDDTKSNVGLGTGLANPLAGSGSETFAWRSLWEQHIAATYYF